MDNNTNKSKSESKEEIKKEIKDEIKEYTKDETKQGTKHGTNFDSIKLKDFEPRLYQQTIFGTCSEKNTLVVLPTGLGKTHIFVMLAVQRLNLFPKAKILFLGPTRPLIEQYRRVFEESTDIDKSLIATLTGLVKPEVREEQWSKARVVFSTPQGLENDIIADRIRLQEVVLLGFDEAHRGVGDYSYVWLAKKYIENARFPRIIGLTASPGHDIEKITEVCQNLHIEAIEIRTDNDPDVMPYIKEVKLEWIKVDFPPELASIRQSLNECLKSKLEGLKSHGLLHAPIDSVNRKELLGLQRELYAKMAAGEKSMAVLKGISLLAEAMKIQHGLELVESQGIEILVSYMEKLLAESLTTKVKALKNLVADSNFKEAVLKARKLSDANIEHPKLKALHDIITDIISSKPDAKIIVFNQYRNQIKAIERDINAIPNTKAKMFVGQAKKSDTGLSQKEQIGLINDFKQDKFNVLCMSSVGEEGLDIPQVDVVIFYEPIPSAIRHIQRRGRTGRQEKGRVIILLAKGTRDEAYRWSAQHREAKMQRTLVELRKRMSLISGQIEKKYDKYDRSDKNANHGKNYDIIHGNSQNNFQGNLQGNLQSNQHSQHSQKSFSAFSESSVSSFSSASQSNANLGKFISSEDRVKIFTDTRERPSKIVKELAELGAIVKLKVLPVGDYILSDRVAAEIKTVPDFVDSIVDGRLLEQVRRMKETYDRPILILEGKEDIYSQRNVHPNAIRGMIATIAVNWNMPILYSASYHETAALLYIIANREQFPGDKKFSPHSAKPITTAEQQEYIVSALPGIGSVIAPKLLEKFKTVRNVMTADEKNLKLVELIGQKKAAEITKILDSEYHTEYRSENKPDMV